MNNELYLFDVDGTVLHWRRTLEDNFLRDALKDDADKFIKDKIKYLNLYESLVDHYDVYTLCSFLNCYYKDVFTPSIVKEWFYVSGNIEDKVEDNALEVFDKLSKTSHIKIVTNWPSDSQKMRLKRTGLLYYADEVIGGDIYLKPNESVFL